MNILNISVTLFLSVSLIKKKIFIRPLTIFVGIYILGQIIGYGLNVDILKAVVPSFVDPENGATIQVITSTGFPLLAAFLSDFIYKLIKN
jgi:hypothetical protein